MRTVALAGGIGMTLLALSAQAANLVVNPGFESGNNGFTSSYAFQSDLGPAGTFFIDNNPQAHNGFFTPVAPHGGVQEMIVNGATGADRVVWAETAIPVQQNTNYFFSVYVTSVFPSSPAQLDFSINNAQIGNIFAAPAVGVWQQFFAVWFSGANTTADLRLVNQNLEASGNDFALDDFAFDVTQPTGGIGVGGTPGDVIATPEPHSLALLAVGLVALGAIRRRLGHSSAT